MMGGEGLLQTLCAGGNRTSQITEEIGAGMARVRYKDLIREKTGGRVGLNCPKTRPPT